jgi:hypothetical protein
MSNLTHLPTSEITIHPIAHRLPAPAADAPEFLALLAIWGETGTQPRPIRVNSFRAVADLDVLAAAKALGKVTVETIEVERLDIPLATISDLVARKHYTKSQIAYLAYPILSPVLEASKKRRVENLKKGVELRKSAQTLENPDPALIALSGAKTLEQLAEVFGVSARFMQYAAQIHRAFDAPGDEDIADGELRAKFEPLILEQDEAGHSTGLGAIVAGIGGYKATRGQTFVPAPQMTLWEERIEKMLAPSKFKGWDKLDALIREKAAQRFAAELFKVAPDEIQTAVLAAARQSARRAA